MGSGATAYSQNYRRDLKIFIKNISFHRREFRKNLEDKESFNAIADNVAEFHLFWDSGC